MNDHLFSHGALVQHGVVVDASGRPTPIYPKGKKNDDLHQDGTIAVTEIDQKGVHPAACWASISCIMVPIGMCWWKVKKVAC